MKKCPYCGVEHLPPYPKRTRYHWCYDAKYGLDSLLSTPEGRIIEQRKGYDEVQRDGKIHYNSRKVWNYDAGNLDPEGMDEVRPCGFLTRNDLDE